MPAIGSIRIVFHSSVKDVQIIEFLKIKGFKYLENDGNNLLTYRDKHRFDGEIICSLDSSEKQVLDIFPGGHMFENMHIFVQQLCLDLKVVFNAELPQYMDDVTQTTIDNLKGETEAEVFFHGTFVNFINQSILVDMLLCDIQDQRMQKPPYNTTNDKLLGLIEVNIVTNMEIFFRELWKYFLLDLKTLPKSVKDKKFERYQLENLINRENDFEGVLASSFSFQNMKNISKNLYEVSSKNFQMKDIFSKLSKRYRKDFESNISSLFTHRHKIVHENEGLGYGANELKENLYDVVRAVGEIYYTICKDKEYKFIMLHESVMTFPFLSELYEESV